MSASEAASGHAASRDEVETLEVTRAEEELRVDRQWVEAGSVRVHKDVVTEPLEQVFGRGVEHATVERTAPMEEDDGAVITFDDGSISVPVLEEELIVTKRVVVRERLLIRKHTVTRSAKVSADLRRERLSLESDGAVEGRVTTDRSTASPA